MYLALIILASAVIISLLVNIPKVMYIAIQWSVILAVLITTLVVTNSGNVPTWLTILNELSHNYHIGDPTGWHNNSPVYRSFIASIYYLTFIGAILLFYLGLSYDNLHFFKNLNKGLNEKLNEKPVWKLVLGHIALMLIFFLPLYGFFFAEFRLKSIEELNENHIIAVSANTPHGLVVIQFLFLRFTNIFGSYIRWAIQRIHSPLIGTTP